MRKSFEADHVDIFDYIHSNKHVAILVNLTFCFKKSFLGMNKMPRANVLWATKSKGCVQWIIPHPSYLGYS